MKNADNFHHFNMSNVLGTMPELGAFYQEAIRSKDLSAGVYRLPANAVDSQGPHTEDEVYYIISGKSKFTLGSDTLELAAGDFIFVSANMEHRFFDIEEDLLALVFFGPPEGDRTIFTK